MKKSLFAFVVMILFYSCEEYQEYFFKEKAKGHRAFQLDGTYVFTYKISDSLLNSDTLRFERLRKNDFLITNISDGDTVYLGEIVKKRGLYFMNKPSGRTGWWKISAFKFSGDSIYNYWGLECSESYQQEVMEQKIFSDYNETESGVYINNTSVETYEAMKHSVMNGLRARCIEWAPPSAKNNFAEEKTSGESSTDVFLVYPNPVRDNLIIETKSDGKFQAEIIDMDGKVVYYESFSESFLMINLSNATRGNYVVRISDLNTNKQNNFKIAVQH